MSRSKLIIVEVIFNDKGRRISKESGREEHFVVDHITGYDELCELVFSRIGSEVVDYIQLIKTIDLPYEPETIKPGVWREICIYHPSSVPPPDSKLVDVESSVSPEFFPWSSNYKRFDSLGISVMRLRTLDKIEENNLMIFELIRAPQEQIDEYAEYKDTLEKLKFVKTEIQGTIRNNDLIERLGGKQEIEKLYTLLKMVMGIFDLYKIGSNVCTGPKNKYRIWTKCDGNDVDYVDTEVDIEKDEFEKDELLLYVLSYIGKGYTGRFGDWWNGGFYGHHIKINEHFSWLYDYCSEIGILAYFYYDKPCHSITELKITYFDDQGMEHKVEIPDFDTLFNTIQEAQEKIDDLYYGTPK